MSLLESVLFLLAAEAEVPQIGVLTVNCNKPGAFTCSSDELIPLAEQIQRENRAFWKGLSVGLGIVSLVLFGGLIYAVFFR
jgi:hypothetical protein